MSLLLLSLVIMSADSPSLSTGDFERSVKVEGRERKYLVHVPKAPHPGPLPGEVGERAPPKRWPVVLAFHGGGSNPRQMFDFSGLNETADKHGFVVVYPAGTGLIETALTFNAGNCCGRALRQKVDEAAFVTAVLDDLEQVLSVDAKRVYATGMSNGAMMSYLVADKLSERIAAIAPVAGPMGNETCSPKRPVAVIHFHGTEDEFAPFAGGVGRRSLTKTNFYSVEHSLAAWRKANGCEEKAKVEELAPKVDDGTRVTRHTYAGGKEGADVVLYEIHGMGHTWPGRTSRFRALGKSTRNLDTNEVMWAFFEQHARK